MPNILRYELLNLGDTSLTVAHLLAAALVLLVAWVTLRVLRLALMRRWGRDDHGRARSLAVHQLTSYALWTAAILVALEAIGLHVTFLLAGSAALLVGVGLGIQQTFNDILSGIIILVEGTIKVGDVMEVDGLVGRVTQINLRTTKVLSRDAILILVPNHKFINENVVNWSHSDMVTRFRITVGVAYGSDVRQVQQLIHACAVAHPDVLGDEPESPVVVRLADFGDSSLDLELLFYSTNIFRIETTKSEIRFAILDTFKQYGISIPFPQRDVHMIVPPSQR
ncbi:MAG: mechanosensitive ion channel domain-containing protein [Flavobacteriales bacterium]